MKKIFAKVITEKTASRTVVLFCIFAPYVL